MSFLPNLITLVRLLLVPLLAFLLLEERYGEALAVFVAAAVSDFADGQVARHFHSESKFGALLDPIADKLTMLAATLMLSWHGLLPVWLAAAMVLRDVVIAGGAVAYHFAVGRLEMAPQRLSKLNTALQFLTLAAVLATAAGLLDAEEWLPPLFALVFATVLLSGAQYVWVWAGKARAGHALRRP